jgi:hypothetical protein
VAHALRSDQVHGGYIPVHGGYIPVHGGYIPVHGGYIPVYGGYIPVHGSYIPVHGGHYRMILVATMFATQPVCKAAWAAHALRSDQNWTWHC